MVDNTTLGEFSIGGTLLGSLTSALGGYETGQSEKEMYDYQAGVARLNATIADQNAEYASQIGEQQAGLYGYKAAQQLGQIKSVQASHGLDIRSGSAAQVQASQRLVSATDMAAIRSNAAKTAFNYRNLAAGDIAQAGADVVAGRNAATAGMIKADTSLIGGASAVDQQWLQGQKAGLWGDPSQRVQGSTFGGG
jgi:hypothetical protein